MEYGGSDEAVLERLGGCGCVAEGEAGGGGGR